MRPPIKILTAEVEESHTWKQKLKISAQRMGCRERSRFSTRRSKNLGLNSKTCIFGVRERERKKLTWKGGLGRPGALWARLGARSRHLAAWTRGGPPDHPQVPLGPSFC